MVALAIGVPLGVAAGRWAWQLTADTLGVHSGPMVPLAAMAAAAVGAVLAANLVAAPGRRAGCRRRRRFARSSRRSGGRHNAG